MKKQEFSIDVGGKTLKVEVSRLAEQANAAVLVSCGETVVLGTAVMSKTDVELPYFPLRVDYEERFYAAGKILGSRFVRREGKPSDEAILSDRLVDRIIRPLFNHQMRREVQVVVTVLAYDEEHDPDILGLLAASLSLSISDIPWDGPVGGIEVAEIGGKVVLNPSRSEKEEGAAFDGFIAGPRGKINMIELGGNDTKEDKVLAACKAVQEEIDKLVAFQEKIVKEVGRAKQDVKLLGTDETLRAHVREFLSTRIEDAVYPDVSGKEGALDKTEREKRLRALREELGVYLEEKLGGGEKINKHAVEILFEKEVDGLVHKNILERELRPDGRKLNEVRNIEAEVGLFARTHGSALFVRGNTQALAVTTLAPPGAAQLIETMEEQGTKRFMLHYNFPPFSVGEVGFFRAPGRREIGHGALASKAIEPLIPPLDEFPYTVRVVSEILSSNGSSSMATVSAAALSLMDAGVPIPKLAAGVAMGMMSDKKGSYKVLTDIQGPEDHYGDMDFKVAGTEDGVNAIQLDVKVGGLTHDIIEEALNGGRDARLHILESIKKVLDRPRAQVSKYAPTVLRHKLAPSKIGLLIGPGGKTINGLIDKYHLAAIDVEEDGTVYISAVKKGDAEQALREIESFTREFEVGEIVEGTVGRIMDFGAIVELGGGKDGLLHVSELKEGFVKNVTDVVSKGDFVRAKVVRVDPDGRIGLSLKQVKGEE